MSDRFFKPEGKTASRRLCWVLADGLLLACLVPGLALSYASGFAVPFPWYDNLILLVGCFGAALLCQSPWVRKHTAVCALGALMLYLLALFLCQNAFFEGMGQFGALVVSTLNRTGSGGEGLAVSGGTADVFLLLCAVPVLLWLAVSLLMKQSLLTANLLLVPLLAFLALCGGATNGPALFLLLLGIVLSAAYTRPRRQYRMWGGDNRQLRQENRIRFQSVQKKCTAWTLAAVLVLSVPAYWLVRPLMAVPLKPARQVSLEIQSRLMTKVGRLLPQISAGAWNLQTQAVGGGVENGALDSAEGYYLEDVEDLRLTLNVRPTETLFLRGYVGTSYHDGSWDNPYASTFDGAAINWKTDGSPRLYIQNLPFLRTAFALEQEELNTLEITPAQLLVERLNAGEAYTYLPYGAYLNDYYEVSAGDGAVVGQSGQEDRFYFFFRQDMESVLTAWNALEDTANVLDRVEEAYQAFCLANDRTQCDGLEKLQETVDAAVAGNRWTPEKNLDEITMWIRQYLAEHCRYKTVPEAAPEGEDPLSYFLFQSGEGSSVHFASAAVALYRMFGIPARYVVGYEVPATLFSAQPGGSFTAVVQSDNAQAWAEIYVPGIGWQPKDMTPGVIGTYEEVGPGGERIEAAQTDDSVTAESLPEYTEPTLPPAETAGSARSWEQILALALYALLTAALGAVLAVLGSRVCRALGLDPFHRRTRRQRLIGVFQALYARACNLGLPKDTDSQSEKFAAFCETELTRRDAEAAGLLRPAVERLYRSSFGGEPVSQTDIQTMRRLLTTLWKRPKK